jgi:hypothetical protein
MFLLFYNIRKFQRRNVKMKAKTVLQLVALIVVLIFSSLQVTGSESPAPKENPAALNELIVDLPAQIADGGFHELMSMLYVNDQLYYSEESLMYPVEKDKSLRVYLFSFSPEVVAMIERMMRAGDNSAEIFLYVDGKSVADFDMNKLRGARRSGSDNSAQILGQRLESSNFYGLANGGVYDLSGTATAVLAASVSCPPTTLAQCTEYYDACVSECGGNYQCIKLCKNGKATCVKGYDVIQRWTTDTVTQNWHFENYEWHLWRCNSPYPEDWICWIYENYEQVTRRDSYEKRVCFFTREVITVLVSYTFITKGCLAYGQEDPTGCLYGNPHVFPENGWPQILNNCHF